MSSQLTQRELRAINEALAARLAGEIEDTGCDPDDYATAQDKIRARIRWQPDDNPAT